jgi:hypothetical protein
LSSRREVSRFSITLATSGSSPSSSAATAAWDFSQNGQ